MTQPRWREQDFVKLWLGQTVSLVGSEITALALPLTATQLLGAGPLQMGILIASPAVAVFALGLPVGVWVDRVRRRPLMIGADLGRALLLCSIPIAAALGALRLEQLYVVALGVGAMTLLFDVAYQSYLPGLVRRARLVEANSRLELSRSVATTIGPGSTGVLVHLFSAPGAVALDALSFVASAISLRWIQAPESVPEARATRTSIDFLAGVRWVAANPLLRPLAATALLISFFDSALIGVLVLYALRELGLTPLGLGLILTAASAGDIAGALLARPIAARLGVGPAVIGGAVVIGLGGALFPLAGGPALLAAAVLAVAELLFRLGALVYSVNQLSLRQAITPDALLGRVNATMRVLIQGVAPVGAVAGGIFAEWLGLRATLIAVAVGLLIAAPLLWASRVRLARDANTEMLAASQ